MKICFSYYVFVWTGPLGETHFLVWCYGQKCLKTSHLLVKCTGFGPRLLGFKALTSCLALRKLNSFFLDLSFLICNMGIMHSTLLRI